ncbi:hypothetical protein ZTR_10594 [Talaromyces verruculosus]|nr:hypothetical protein ZTR_10594 [Talaromyces verruculosus]
MGCYEISLGDTLGVGVPGQTERLIRFLVEAGIPVEKLAGHFHDTYGQAIGNTWAAYQCGIRVFDSSVAGLGGCPYAPGAKGNVATEDVAYMFEQAGIKTGVDLDVLVETGIWISKHLNKENGSRAGRALSVKRGKKLISKTTPQTGQSNAETPRSLQWDHQLGPELLKLYRSGTNLKIVLDRPRNGNALTTNMISSLTDLMEKISKDRSITRVAITARGRFFCTGMDLGKISSPVSQGQTTVEAQYERLTKLFEAISNSPQVTIACVQGPAFGGGIGLAFACDIRMMVKHANLTFSEIKLGLCPATISKQVIRELSIPFAREAMLSGRTILPVELARIGAVAKVVETELDLSKALDDYLTNLKQCAPQASQYVKHLVKLSWEDGGGGVKQEEGIRKIFMNMMMSDNRESAFGLQQFQKGNKRVDWDPYTLAKQPLNANL